MDPARAGPGGARQGAAVQGPARRAHRLDPADPRHALPPGRARAARGVLAAGNRAALEAGAGLSPAGAQAVTVALRQIDRLDAEIDALLAEIRSFAAIQPGCKALQRQYGIGKLTAVIIWADRKSTRLNSSHPSISYAV